MARPQAPCGTVSAYRRHKRNGEPVDDACAAAQLANSRANSGKSDDDAQSAPVVPLRGAFTAATGASVDARERLIANLKLVERAMEAIADVDAQKVVLLSKRHSEIVAELVAVSGAGAGGAGADPIDRFFDAGGAAGRAAPAPRKPS